MTEPTRSSAICRRLFAPLDAGSLACFRIMFGALLVWKTWGFLLQGGVQSEYLTQRFHFTYLGFDWVHTLPTVAMHLLVVMFGLLAVCLLMGQFYRIAVSLFGVGYVYLFLLEKTYYLNHEYLICLLCFLMVFVPAHRVWSLDSLRQDRPSGSTVPTWTLWLLRFQIAIPYIYGGIAKLDRDWLQGASVRLGLQERLDVPFIGGWLELDTIVGIVVYGGLLFDLLIVPCLLWPGTRMAAFVIVVLFHVTNAILFNIGVFPWLMIAATTLFLPADWPRQVMRWIENNSVTNPNSVVVRVTESAECVAAQKTEPNTLTTYALLLFVTVQLVLPFRHYLYPGNASWTGEGDNFSWRMMLNHKRGGVEFYAVNPETKQRLPIDVRPMLSRFQYRRLISDPDLILQFAHRLAESFREDAFDDFQIHAVVLVSLNGRRPQLLIDPDIDLSRQQRSVLHQSFVLPLTETLPEELWDVPVRDWQEDFPELFPATTEDASPESGPPR